jgi:MoaA/NifB/PqqE/SkfB family radical SAM enzyme
MASKQEKLRIIAFEVTRRCRFQCKHCRANAGVGGEEELTTKQCKRILGSVAKFSGTASGKTKAKSKRGKPVIIFTGGEPMERSDIYELIRYGRNLGLRIVMATCGYLIDDESIAKLKKAGVQTLSFSLDGCRGCLRRGDSSC